MKLKIIKSVLAFAILISIGCQETGSGESKASSKAISLATSKDSVSYAIGNDIFRSLENIKDEINFDLLVASLKANHNGDSLLLKPENSKTLLQNFSQNLQKKQRKKSLEEGEKNKTEGEKFLAENKTKEGVITTESGLQYKVITQGTGPKPASTDKVTVHYKGTLLDGKEFDSSIKRGQPASFGVTGVIKGWTEALQLMNTGSKYQLFIPSDLAYGSRGTGSDIKANATLIFEVELISIDKDKPIESSAVNPPK